MSIPAVSDTPLRSLFFHRARMYPLPSMRDRGDF